MTLWTAVYVWRGSTGEARKRISEWTGTFAWSALEFQVDEAGSASVAVTFSVDTIVEALELSRKVVDGFLGPETILQSVTTGKAA